MTARENNIFVVENEYKTREAFMALLEHNNSAYTYLLENNYVKTDTGNEFAFCFVGVICFRNTVICVLPKYYKGLALAQDRIVSDFVTIIKVLKKIGRTDQIPDSRNFSSNEYLNMNEVVLADKFLRDYLDNGIYNKNREIHVLNGESEINWDISVNSLTPIFTKRRPIYSEVYTSSTITEDYNIITELHKWVIRYCLQRFGRILDYKFSFLEDCVTELYTLGPIDYILRVLNRELNVTYTDREILLLKRLISFLKNQQDKTDHSFTLYGTGYFHSVWENVNGTVFRNKLRDFKHLIPSPQWNDNEGNSVSKDTLIPDIVSTIEGDESKFFIFDAKYYNLQYSKIGTFDVSGNPGVQDISKQFLYEMAFSTVPYVRKYNCFLFPHLGTNFFEIAGSVTFPLFHGAVIHNVLISPDLLFKAYLNNSSSGVSLLSDIATALDGE